MVSRESPCWLVLKEYPIDDPLAQKATENHREPTSAECQAAHANLLRDRVENVPTEGVEGLTHPSCTPTKHDNIVVLESLIHSIPNQTTPNHGSARCWVVGYLGKLSGVDLDSLG